MAEIIFKLTLMKTRTGERNWSLEMNIVTCKFMHLTGSSHELQTYYLNNVPLGAVAYYKYLGVHVTNDLPWAAHITWLTNNAIQILWYIRGNVSQAPSTLKRLLYITTVRSTLEYTAAVRNPGHEQLKHSLNVVQNTSARFMLTMTEVRV